MPNHKTFRIKPIRSLILEEIYDGKLIDPFANEASIKEDLIGRNIEYISNDLDTQFDVDYHLDALEFFKLFEDSSVDIVLYDPPYSVRQVSECYKSLGRTVNMETTQSSFWTKMKSEIQRVVKPGGKVISAGWNSNGIGITLGFTLNRILLVAHGGIHNDTIIVVETKDKKKSIL